MWPSDRAPETTTTTTTAATTTTTTTRLLLLRHGFESLSYYDYYISKKRFELKFIILRIFEINYNVNYRFIYLYILHTVSYWYYDVLIHLFSFISCFLAGWVLFIITRVSIFNEIHIQLLCWLPTWPIILFIKATSKRLSITTLAQQQQYLTRTAVMITTGYNYYILLLITLEANSQA